MKVIIAYPPLISAKGYPTLGQNRQFQYFTEPTYIYPVVPAQAATLLKRNGYDVLWLDSIAENISRQEFIEIIKKEKPDLIAFETKTPVVKQHWKMIDELSSLSIDGKKVKTVLFGDHVTALPEESMLNCKVDFILTGGDYDFLLLNLCNLIAKSSTFSLNSGTITKLEAGIWYRDDNRISNTGKFKLDHELDNIPFIDRDLTKWRNYAFKNGNYKLKPGTYIMSARDCWWGKCTFCSWPTLYPRFRSRSVNSVLDEVGILIDKYGVKEIMDDSGSLPTGSWLSDFCNGARQRGYNKDVYFDCNMRFGALNFEEYKSMKSAGFRLLLFGIESANQSTLDRINKNLKVEEIITSCKDARRAGLYPHITIMFGYPWETYDDAVKTLKLGRWLLLKGYAYTMQATIVIPYPGSMLFDECRSNGWLKYSDWDDYDMTKPVMKTLISDDKLKEMVEYMYKISLSPEFIFRKLISIRDLDDLKYYFMAAKKVIGHIADFKRGKCSCRSN
ncbi:MAG: radical SAM protein [Candidatus Omnitrophota bacterium]|nr:MAG: radical SAM protein [Candidatus Omnitrophota bacterium]